jgi:hypothetical protein
MPPPHTHINISVIEPAAGLRKSRIEARKRMPCLPGMVLHQSPQTNLNTVLTVTKKCLQSPIYNARANIKRYIWS